MSPDRAFERRPRASSSISRMFMQRVAPGSAEPRGGRGAHEADTPPAPDIVDITLFLDDYKPVDGVMLPHHITRSIGGEANEELTFKTIKVNPAFKADVFVIRN